MLNLLYLLCLRAGRHSATRRYARTAALIGLAKVHAAMVTVGPQPAKSAARSGLSRAAYRAAPEGPHRRVLNGSSKFQR
eukprot:12622100-Alexandrium_andersonii.AAC.1